MRRRLREDDGQLLLLILVYAAIAIALVVVVVDVSKLFLYRRALSGAADAAALAASQSPDEGQLLTVGVGSSLPLSQDSVEVAVDRYVANARLSDRFPGLTWTVTTDGAIATVEFEAPVKLPFTGAVLDGGSARITVDASAESPVTP
ncbi:MAG: hypothetical protein QOK42_1922 [Frankiaceae bacterium]|nr:hypothetical protein [Frankiaceae bacterium]MDX6275752.1 hypothetical protein [Frankiales bacterium]